MLDVPNLGLDLLNRAMTYVAQTEEDSEIFEQSMTILETAKNLVDRTPLRKALSAVAKNSADYIQRERDVMTSMLQVDGVMRMAKE